MSVPVSSEVSFVLIICCRIVDGPLKFGFSLISPPIFVALTYAKRHDLWLLCLSAHHKVLTGEIMCCSLARWTFRAWWAWNWTLKGMVEQLPIQGSFSMLLSPIPPYRSKKKLGNISSRKWKLNYMGLRSMWSTTSRKEDSSSHMPK